MRRSRPEQQQAQHTHRGDGDGDHRHPLPPSRREVDRDDRQEKVGRPLTESAAYAAERRLTHSALRGRKPARDYPGQRHVHRRGRDARSDAPDQE